jgi:hypothetical protein
MAGDLERYFGVAAVAEQRLIKCYVLRASTHITKVFSKGAPASVDLDEESSRTHITNGQVEELRSYLESILHQPVLDETGVVKKIDLVFPEGFFHFSAAELKVFLQEAGIFLDATERRLWVPRLKPVDNQIPL